MTASITEALRIARGYVADDVKRKPSGYDPSSDLRVIDAALASLSCGEARERIARMIRRAMIDNPTGGTSEERAAKRASIADEYATAYLADLATGCVPGEAAIRADQIIMSRALVEQAHAAMLETGWHLAPAHATSGDGVIEAAVAEIEERFAAAIRAGRGEG